MNTVIYNPTEEYAQKFKAVHGENVQAYFDRLVEKSQVNIEENRITVEAYRKQVEKVGKLSKRVKWLKFWRVLLIVFSVIGGILTFEMPLCLLLPAILLPLLFWQVNPKIKNLDQLYEEENAKAQALLQKAYDQMKPLNDLFHPRDVANLIEQTLPQMDLHDYFSRDHEVDMEQNYDYLPLESLERSTLNALSGTYNGNPFVYEQRLVHTMGVETYHGYLTIHWTETKLNSEGRLVRVSRSETLHATVVKPKPFYHTENVLHYGAQGAPELCFSRDAGNMDDHSQRALERKIKAGERKLQKMDDDSVKNDTGFTSMANTRFEVLFDALDRNHEVQFRTLFTPLAQTNMEELLLSDVGFGDDFSFRKVNRMNHILSDHSKNKKLYPHCSDFYSYCFDEIQSKFTTVNAEYFKQLYFDFAPLLAIPMYQEHPVDSLKPLPDYNQKYSLGQYEALANSIDADELVHEDTKTAAILKAGHLRSDADGEWMGIDAHSYDIIPRVEYVSVHGGDGRWHNVAVPWDDYLPLVAHSVFLVRDSVQEISGRVCTHKDGLYAIKQ